MHSPKNVIRKKDVGNYLSSYFLYKQISCRRRRGRGKHYKMKQTDDA